MTDRLKGKIAIITGSTSGIGRASAELFAEEGAKLVVSASGRRPELGNEVVEGIKKKGGEAVWCKADVRKKDDIKNLIQFTLKHFGGLDVLMNNAYGGKHGSVVDLTEAEWDDMFQVTVKSVFLGCKFAIPEMIKRGGGSIVNIASTHGLLGYNGSANYGAAKAAIINLTRQIAIEYGRSGIRANSILPGRVVIERKKKYLAENPFEARRQKSYYPIGRAGTPKELAYAALFLASDEASFITGLPLVADGGLTAQMPDTTAIHVENGIREELAAQGIIWPEYKVKGSLLK